MFLLGLAIALWMRAKRPAQYAVLGHFDHADPVDTTGSGAAPTAADPATA